MREEALPCSHCGLCCIATPCEVGITLGNFKEQETCPALEWENEESRCGLLTNPEKHLPERYGKPFANIPLATRMQIMDSGTGCSMKGKALLGGMLHYIPTLPPEIKQKLAQIALQGKSKFIHTKK